LASSPDKVNNTTQVAVALAMKDSYQTLGGITKVPSSLAYDSYKYGYADVHSNGASDGNAVNPYNTTGGGGDGYDLEWAVDIGTGLPVDLSQAEIHFVRVYTAPLNPQSGFGEISTEVTGILTAYPLESPAGVTSQPTLMVNGAVIPPPFYSNGSILNQNVTGSTARVTLSGADNVLLNNELGNISVNLDIGETRYVRAVAQSGTLEPYIVTIVLNRTS
jgi:hypothetical protein